MSLFGKTIKNAFILSITMLIICGLIYPLALTGISQIILNKQANGNLIMVDGEAVGSALVGQQFTDAKFFKGRISAVGYNTYTEADTIPDENGETAYAGVASGSFNYGPSNEALHSRVEADIAAFLEANPGIKKEDIPTDLLTASGSGLDPHISVQSASIQIPSIAKASGLSAEQLAQIIADSTEHKILGIFGEEKVNVLKANIAIADAIG